MRSRKQIGQIRIFFGQMRFWPNVGLAKSGHDRMIISYGNQILSGSDVIFWNVGDRQIFIYIYIYSQCPVTLHKYLKIHNSMSGRSEEIIIEEEKDFRFVDDMKK